MFRLQHQNTNNHNTISREISCSTASRKIWKQQRSSMFREKIQVKNFIIQDIQWLFITDNINIWGYVQTKLQPLIQIYQQVQYVHRADILIHRASIYRCSSITITAWCNVLNKRFIHVGGLYQHIVVTLNVADHMYSWIPVVHLSSYLPNE